MATVAHEPVLARDEAFEQLYRRYVKEVYHYALALLRNPADAEDVTQTTFMNAYRAYRRGDEILKPHNWLIKIAHNVARTRYARSTRRVKEVPLEDHVDQLAVPESERPNVEAVLRALGRLPFNQRAALVMRELEGRSYAEIADTLGVSVTAVETLIFRARRSLRIRASALRSLGVVPLPGSLAGLFEGGAVVAGGGALIGTGVVAKTAVALVAGVLATSLGGGQGNRAVAAFRPQPSPAVVSPTTSAAKASRIARAVAERASLTGVQVVRLDDVVAARSAQLDGALTSLSVESSAAPATLVSAPVRVVALPATTTIPTVNPTAIPTVTPTVAPVATPPVTQAIAPPTLPATRLPAPPTLPATRLPAPPTVPTSTLPAPVQPVVSTVQRTVAAPTSALPVQVPLPAPVVALPTPPLPKLP